MRPMTPDHVWAAGLVDTFPHKWAGSLLDRWATRRHKDEAAGVLDWRRDGNLQLLQSCESIKAAHAFGLPADAGDEQIRSEAKAAARDMGRRLQLVEAVARRDAPPASPWCVDWPARWPVLAQYAHALDLLQARGIDRRARGLIEPFLRRLKCERWWRRVLRRMHARATESTARALGLVHKRAGCYVSDDGLKRRLDQRERTAMALEGTHAVNEHGEDYSIAELSARSPANRAIRRMELMTRIAGFELIAKECQHAAYFVTVTCPSRMHAYRTQPGTRWGVERNPRWDGTTPDAAQKHLRTAWNRFTSACARWGVELYGFRIAEPNHDGTPHWHALLFFPEVVAAGTVKVNRYAGRPVAHRLLVCHLRKKFLHDADPDERGARQHRVSLERIDWKRGSAAGYVAKYVSKNIDGYRVEKDLYGNDTLASSLRVDAWASTWGIRQFQQIGGAPVSTWRELRRLHPEQAQASTVIALALDAVNASQAAPAAETDAVRTHTAAHGWRDYLQLQGGHRVKRRALRLHVLREHTGEFGRYGELSAPQAVGVVTTEVLQEHIPAFGIVPAMTRTLVQRIEVESERLAWIVVPSGAVEATRQRMEQAQAEATKRRKEQQAGAAGARPWSPVNNSTRPAPLFQPAVRRVPKKGRVFSWQRAAAASGASAEAKTGPTARQEAAGERAGTGLEGVRGGARWPGEARRLEP